MVSRKRALIHMQSECFFSTCVCNIPAGGPVTIRDTHTAHSLRYTPGVPGSILPSCVDVSSDVHPPDSHPVRSFLC